MDKAVQFRKQLFHDLTIKKHATSSYRLTTRSCIRTHCLLRKIVTSKQNTEPSYFNSWITRFLLSVDTAGRRAGASKWFRPTNQKKTNGKEWGTFREGWPGCDFVH